MVFEQQINYQSVLDGLGQGVLIFDTEDRLVMDNLAARNILGQDLKLIRANGWSAATALFNTRSGALVETAESARQKAVESSRPVRFRIYRSGEHMPCYASTVYGMGGEIFTMITIEQPDWTAMSEMLEHFKDELETAADSSMGYSRLISQALKNQKNESVDQIGRRINGFVTVMNTQMHRTRRLMKLFTRFEQIRTGKLAEQLQTERRRINLADFMEDFMEDLTEVLLLDPETEQQDYRARVTTAIPDNLYILASTARLTDILHDLLRNAIMYSMKATQIMIVAQISPQNQTVQLDVADEGYGIRAKEFERVFALFERARQPQIMGEFGYGLSLYVCKHEIEAMNGKIWFESEENVGTTFSFKLPLWRDDSSGSSLA